MMKKTLLLLLAMALLPGLTNLNAQVIEADSLALVDIYTAADGPNWTGADNWLVGQVSSWEGVTIDTLAGRVVDLGINQMNVGGNGGTLSPSIGDLTALTRFEIQDAPTLTGPIPAELWNCINIGRLQLKFTGLTGGIPAGIESMVNAYELNFQGTRLGGEIPSELYELPALTKPYLHQSDFTGTVPSTVTSAMGLQRFYIQENKLVGPLPLVNLPAGQAKVNIMGNFFTFADVKPYHDAAANFAAFTDDYQLAGEPTEVVVDKEAEYTMTGTVTDGESYAWFKDDETVPVGTSETLVLSNISLNDEGSYVCKAQSSMVANFDIRTIYELMVNATDRERDSLALLDIYNAADGANWTNAEHWGTGVISDWEGVIIDTLSGRVVELGINQMNMGGNGGTLSPSIGDLTALTRFEIQDAPNLTGSIPAELWNCTNIGRLQLKFTGLTGGIPAGIESMVNAYELNFQGTRLGGEIPPELFELPSLTKPYLHQSDFTGSVPSTLAGAMGLERLYLHENKLTGSIPYVDLPVGQAKVNLMGNFFTFAEVKQYHDSAANFASFTDDYQLAGEPVEAVVEEGDEYTMTGTVTDGESYAWFKDDESVPVGTSETLVVSNISFDEEGSYVCKAQSSMVANFDIRTIYEIKLNYSDRERDSMALVEIYNAADGANWTNADNWGTGVISDWEGVIIDTLSGRVVELGINQMNAGGTLSPSIGKLTALTRFEIQDAPNLTGSIPAELWNCTNIGRLQLKFTGLTGGIPAGIESMVNAYELNFQGTKLGGEIPPELFELPSLTKPYLHQSDFTGSVPSTLAGAMGLERLYLHENKLTGSIPYVDLPVGQAKVNLMGNFFTFAEVKQYHDSAANFASFTDDFQYAQEDQHFSLSEGDAVDFTLTVENGEAYTWFYNDGDVPVSADQAYGLASAVPTDTGTYVCKVQSSMVANFDIRAIFVVDTVIASVSIDKDRAAISTIYPNPFTEYIEITSASNIEAISISDITGKTVWKQISNYGNKAVLPLSDLHSGLYLISVKTAESSSVQRIIKQ